LCAGGRVLLKTPGSLVTRSFGWRPKKEQSVSQFFRIFWPLFLARLRAVKGQSPHDGCDS